MNVGKRIYELREQRQLTTNKLANLAGVSQSYLREIELEKRTLQSKCYLIFVMLCIFRYESSFLQRM